MPRPTVLRLLFAAFALLLAAFVIWPEMDLAVSGLFASRETGFYLNGHPLLVGLGKVAFYGARGLALLFVVGLIVASVRRQTWLGVSNKGWLFLLLALLVGPGLLANVVFKDHWGRARPRTIEAFGGTAAFTPALVPSKACQRNCSFVSGDGSFGFFLPCFGFVAAPRHRRKVFWTGMGLGVVFGGARILLGAHFLSDVLFAGFLSLAVGYCLHALLFGKETTRDVWGVFWGNRPEKARF